MTAYAILGALASLLAAIGWFIGRLRRGARDRAALTVATDRAESAEVAVAAAVEVAAGQAAGHVDARAVEAAAVGEHPERAAARERVRIQDVVERRHTERVRSRIARRR